MPLLYIRLRWRLITLIGHLVVVSLSYVLAWLLRFDFAIPASELPLLKKTLLAVVIAKLVVFVMLRHHLQPWWRHQGFSDMLRLLRNKALASVGGALTIYLIAGTAFPRSVYILDFLLCFMIGGLGMSSVRIYHELTASRMNRSNTKGLLIYGAGVAGIALAREIRENPLLGYRVLGFLDDDQSKVNNQLLGFPVLGTMEDANRIVASFAEENVKVEEIAIAMPSASSAHIRAAVEAGQRTGAYCRVVPGLGELMSGKLSAGQVRDVAVKDILGRPIVELDLEAVKRMIEGRSVLVTGAAGSIGSELCHQIAGFEPFRLIAVDQAESELFRLEAELRARFPKLNVIFEVGDICDSRHMNEVIDDHAITSIFHAAAYKHVPLMERQICEAVQNNVLGTWTLAQAACRANVPNFLLISTDKAVNPTSIMGLTKRVTELLLSAQRKTIGNAVKTKFVAVRFGNVLVSNGSVVPTFQKQIAAGGPVTVTHPEMRRYFMTVREAVQLVLQASGMGRGSEIFVLDMGTPVKIVDLARNLITLAGFKPDEDIEIRYTGLRPGEKLYEELSFEGEDIVATDHPKIRIFKGPQISFREVAPWVAELQHLLWKREAGPIIDHLHQLVPEYRPGVSGLPESETSVTSIGVTAKAVATVPERIGIESKSMAS